MKLTLIAALALSGALISPALAQDTHVLRLGMQGTEGDPQFLGVTEAARVLAESSGGRITLEIFPNSQLGNFTEMTEQLQLGELDLTLNPFGGFDPWVERAVLASTPYVVRDFAHLEAIIASDWGQGVVAELAADDSIRIIDNWYFGTRHTTTNRPINGPADFAGLKLRVPNSAPLLSWATAMGASPTPVAFAEVYLALQTNQVDGQENPLPTIDSMKFMEVQSYLALTGHLVQDQSIVISELTWAELSADDQALVIAAFDAGGIVNNDTVTAREAALVEQFTAAGTTVTTPDRAALMALMAPVYAELDTRFGEGSVATLTDIAP
jgi:tripartite ATP-independent transporter DctP family solute receptor